MNQRTFALTAGVAVAALALSGACTNGGGGGGGGGRMMDCGTIDAAAPLTQEDTRAINCWQGAPTNPTGGYHTGHFTRDYKVTSVDNGVTTTYETVDRKHQIRITRRAADGTVTTKMCGDNQFVESQILFDRTTGKPPRDPADCR